MCMSTGQYVIKGFYQSRKKGQEAFHLQRAENCQKYKKNDNKAQQQMCVDCENRL